jgi:hypothetical protein
MGSAQVASSAYLPAPLNAAPVIPDYPQFGRGPVPADSGAVAAWTGVVQPFFDDAAARRFLRCLEAGKPFDVVGGTIDAHAPANTSHWADPWLVNMQTCFTLLVLEFEGKAHPRAYALRPEISLYCNPNPHLRCDKTIRVGRQELPALCIYSGAAFSYRSEWPKIVQFLDQTSAYLGRHLIWLHTRVENGSPARVPSPGELILDVLPRIQADPVASIAPRRSSRWVGYWPGPVAPSGFSEHLRTVRPSQECWCCSGERYRDCHRPFEECFARRALVS